MDNHKNCKHDHHHDHHHHHAPKNYNRAFAIGISLNVIFVIIEAVYGLYANSLALVADAGHNLSDVAGLVIAWGAFWLSNKKPTARYTFGFRKSSILSALFNAVFLLVAVGIIIWEAIHRLITPNIVETKTVMIVAFIGIVINALTALLFFKDKNHDINIRGAYVHMAADALISFGVVLSAFMIAKTNWFWLDPFVSIIISLIIIYGTIDLLKNSTKLSMDAVPESINPKSVKEYLNNLPGVVDVHDMHIWPMSTTDTAISVHLTVDSKIRSNDMLAKISADVNKNFNINHATVQVEVFDKNFECHLKPDDII